MRKLSLVQVVSCFNGLPKAFPQFNFYLFGSMARNGVGNDVDLMVEVDDEVFHEVSRELYISSLHPLLKKVVDDPNSYYWTYFSPFEKRLKIALEVLDLSKLETNELRSALLREEGLLDIIFLPKNWREKKVLEELRKQTDQYDEKFFDNLLKDARKLRMS